MKPYRTIVLAFAAALSLALVAPVEGYQLGGKELAQKGTGARKMAFLTVYYASLYLPAEMKDADAAAIIEADAPMSIVMKIDSGLVKKDSFVSAVRGGFEKAAAAGYKTAGVQQYLALFDKLTIVKGDVFYQNYVPKQGLTVVYKSAASGQSATLGTVAAIDLKKAFFAMFIGSNPIDAGLKKGMMGK